ncbi:MAG: hypothetical protein GX558_07415 [Clostridiales bacterium]|nr:hypothetical protein [Clostridiales bacterium]
MFIDRRWCRYPSMSALLANARRTGVYPDPDRPAHVGKSVCISDALLYVQSNGRAQLGQDELGRMHYLGTVAQRDFALPTLTAEPDQLIAAHSGMAYQADVALMLGKVGFSLALDDGTAATAGGEGSISCYLDHFLPMTTSAARGLRLSAFSLAPMLEPGVPSAIEGLPLPGPGGAVHALNVRNERDQAVSFEARMSLDPLFVSQYQYSHVPIDESAHPPFRAEWDRNLLFMWRPDACAMVQAQGFLAGGTEAQPTFARRVELRPGEEVTLTCYAVISTDAMDLRPALAALYRHTALEWINITAHFWRERLGEMRAEDGDRLAQRSLDFHARSVLDNFNCYQMNQRGEVVAHLQGAPSQVSGRLWGIDAEPTALSVMYALPELGPTLLNYIVDRNQPAYSVYADHSTPIFMAPLVIAAKYAELTSDWSALSRGTPLARKLADQVRALLATRHECGLVHSRYSSDGHVFNRYDFGTNCKAHYALSGIAPVLRAMGEEALAGEAIAAADRLAAALRDRLCADGPFGRQYTGGDNLGEHDPFYLRDDLMYYDGEDSSSCLAPLYGAVGWRDAAWRNYHRFASSLFATNYDAEADALRWYAWGGAIDATALVSAVGGSTTRADMRRRLDRMLDLGTDETGAMFWWPLARNCVRNLTRCSQGQGAWVFQHTEQWLGLRPDAAARRLRVAPQGMYGGYEWRGLRLGDGRFDLALRQLPDGLQLRLVNLGGEPWTIELAGRVPGAAFSGEGRAIGVAAPGAELLLTAKCGPSEEADIEPIEAVENRAWAADGPAIGTYLYSLPRAGGPASALIVPFALLTGPLPLKNAVLTIEAPEGWAIEPKRPLLLDQPAGRAVAARVELGDLAAGRRLACPFYLTPPEAGRCRDAWLTRAPFSALDEGDIERRLMLKGDGAERLGVLSARLTWIKRDGGDGEARFEVPIDEAPAAEFDRIRLAIFGGACAALHPRLS